MVRSQFSKTKEWPNRRSMPAVLSRPLFLPGSSHGLPVTGAPDCGLTVLSFGTGNEIMRG